MKPIGPFIAAALLALPGGAAAEKFDAEVMTHAATGNVAVVEGAKAQLVSTAEGIAGEFSTQGLKPGHVYTMWVAILNQPENCEMVSADHCTAGDVVGRADIVDSDVTYGDGAIAGADGSATFRTFVPAGALEGSWMGNALKDPMGAEVHFALHDHGPMIEGQLPEMLTTARAGCTDESLPAGWPDSARANGATGPNACQMAQFSIFKQK
ncbi:hypothetical protein [Limimaricola pyoseonensis]|uniref:Uncharacterized protein n=1 Tax=Limimaricola pyoseonensis TaxID=521013 RepID=A0A1G7ERZ4_9RHOB|nr:hypothetical protein [Limimaricola pyoseonensis]SDE66185.1 hypothetical protein SAMN04488567_2264 [Limimaricola pyoseonensis]